MNTQTPNVEDALTTAEALIESRMDAVRRLVEADHAAVAAAEAKREADRARSEAWKAARDAGWTEPELRKVGLKAERKRTTTRRRTSTAKTTTGTDNAMTSTTDGHVSDHGEGETNEHV